MPVQPREEREQTRWACFPWPVWMTEPFRQTWHRPWMWTSATMIRRSATESYTRAFGRTSARSRSSTLAKTVCRSTVNSTMQAR